MIKNIINYGKLMQSLIKSNFEIYFIVIPIKIPVVIIIQTKLKTFKKVIK